MEGEGTTSVVGSPCDSLQVVGLHSGTMGHGSLLSRSFRKNTRSPLNADAGTELRSQALTDIDQRRCGVKPPLLQQNDAHDHNRGGMDDRGAENTGKKSGEPQVQREVRSPPVGPSNRLWVPPGCSYDHSDTKNLP